MKLNPLARFAWATLVFNVAVVLFGAVVRATGSGAGCGSDWPVCRGAVIPFSPSTETAIEFTHRVTSGIALVMVTVLVIWVLKTRPGRGPIRTAVLASGALIIVEALIGAALVVFEWVADDTSVARAIAVVVHLSNTFLLLAALTLTALWLSGRSVPRGPLPPTLTRPFAIGAGLLMVAAALGAIAALGDTLFPPDGVGTGLRRDISGALLERLRWLHPVAALAAAAYVLRVAPLMATEAPGPARALRALVVAQVAAGVVNVLLLAPLWMQVTHLLLADLLWIAFVVGTSEALAAARSRVAV